MATPSSGRSKKNIPEPVRMCDMDLPKGLINSAKSSAKKIFKFQPVRMCDMDFNAFNVVDKSAMKNPARKQLWPSTNYGKKFGTSMKPDKNIVRKSTLNRPIANQISVKKNFNKDETLPLIDSENYFQNPNKLKKTLIYSSISNANKKSLINSCTPKVVVSNRRTLLGSPKIKIDTLNKRKSSEIVNKRKSVNLNKRKSVTQIPSVNLNKGESLNDMNYIKNIFTEMIKEMKLDILNEMSNLFDQKLANIKCPNCGIKTFNNDTKIEYQNSEKSNTELTTNLKSDVSKKYISTPQVNGLIDDLLQMESGTINNKSKKFFEKTIIPVVKVNDFEIIESRLKDGSPLTDEFSLNETNSPAVIHNDINWLINDKDDIISPSAVHIKTTKKNITFCSKIECYTDTVSEYNEIRDNAKFLCTPKNTKTVSNLMTPSVKNSQKKLISRKVQEQLLMLN